MKKFSKKQFEAIKKNRKIWKRIKKRREEGYVDLRFYYKWKN